MWFNGSKNPKKKKKSCYRRSFNRLVNRHLCDAGVNMPCSHSKQDVAY